MRKHKGLVYRRPGSSNWYITGLRISTGTDDKKAAEAYAAKLKLQSWERERMGAKPPRSWKEATVRWLTEKAHKHDIEGDRAKLRWIDQHLGAVSDLQEITRERIDGIMLERGGVSASDSRPGNSTSNRYVALISAILNAAEREWEWGNRAPVLRRYPEPKEEQRWLTVEEWRRLENALPKHLRLAATFSISTGLREAKVFGLRWTQVSMNQRSLSFTGTANKIGASIPLNATALSVLAECRSLPVISPEHVFLYQGHALRGVQHYTWEGAFKRAGVEYMKWHGLRHTFNSWLAQNGVPEEIRKKLMGHSTGSVHQRYTHFEVEHLRPYSEVIDRVLNEQKSNRDDGRQGLRI